MQRGRPIISSDGRTFRCLKLSVRPSCPGSPQQILCRQTPCPLPARPWLAGPQVSLWAVGEDSSSLAPFQPVSWTSCLIRV